MLHVRHGPLLGGRHCELAGQDKALVMGDNRRLDDELHDEVVASL